MLQMVNHLLLRRFLSDVSNFDHTRTAIFKLWSSDPWGLRQAARGSASKPRKYLLNTLLQICNFLAYAVCYAWKQLYLLHPLQVTILEGFFLVVCCYLICMVENKQNDVWIWWQIGDMFMVDDKYYLRCIYAIISVDPM